MSDTVKDHLLQIRHSDRNGLAMLYNEMADPLLRYAGGLTGDKNKSMDIVHDVFVKIWEHRMKIEIRGSARAFLYTMVRNHFLNEKKKADRAVPTDFQSMDVSAWHSTAFVDSPDQQSSSLSTILLEWIRQLPARRGEAFMLSRFHDLSHEQISHIMGLSERTVDTHIQHALRDLRLLMKQHEVA